MMEFVDDGLEGRWCGDMIVGGEKIVGVWLWVW
jgi:hypothetical protein